MKPALLLYPHISAYPVLLLLGFFFGWLLCRSRAERYGIGKNHLDNIALLLPITGLFGARLFARLFYAKLPLLEALKVWEGEGLVFYGGFIASALAVILYGVLRKMPLVRLLDCVAPSVALGLAFGRVGCFLAGCCWGDVCIDHSQVASLRDQTVALRIQTFPAISPEQFPLAVQFPQKSAIYKQHVRHGLISGAESKSLPVHPVQLYEAVLAALLCFYAARPRLAKPGDVALMVMVGYALIRFATEFLRADNKVYALGMTFSQVVSVYILLGCAVIALLRQFLSRSDTPTTTEPVEEPAAVGNFR
ncbi:MAG TPA: prolipoprotein diacylglyceryl transferase [Verrucomicrobiae bacterium]